MIDSVLNMTIGDQLQNQQKILSLEKVERLRKIIKNRQISTVNPARPDRRGLNSEVVIEKKLALGKSLHPKKISNLKTHSVL